MIAFIITGHGTYAPGMTGAMEMITGKQENLKTIPFLEGMTPEDFTQEIVTSIHEFKQEGLEIVVFADLLGGTPFKTAAAQAFEQQGIVVVSGTNLPMLIEGAMMRLAITDAQQLVNQLLSTGRDGIQSLEIVMVEQEETDDLFTDGI